MQAIGNYTIIRKHLTFATMIMEKTEVNTKEERGSLTFWLPGYLLYSSFVLVLHHFHEAFTFVLRNKWPPFNRKCKWFTQFLDFHTLRVLHVFNMDRQMCMPTSIWSPFQLFSDGSSPSLYSPPLSSKWFYFPLFSLLVMTGLWRIAHRYSLQCPCNSTVNVHYKELRLCYSLNC